jgi:hypothetical protein
LARFVLVKRKNRFDEIIAADKSQGKFKDGWYSRLKALAAEAGVPSPV